MINVTTVRPVIEVEKLPLPKIGQPNEVKIVLGACNCHIDQLLTFYYYGLVHVSKILGISNDQLIGHILTAMASKEPQVVACFQQADLAETKLAQLRGAPRFIARVCYLFDLMD